MFRYSFKTTSLLLSACLFISTFVACSATKGYSGSSRSASEVAVVRGYGVTLHQVNGVDVSSFSSTVEILPGENVIQLSINASNFNSRDVERNLYTLKMKAEAGMQYAVTSKRGYGPVCAYLIEPETGATDYSSSAGCITR
jgi:hypothetical protein